MGRFLRKSLFEDELPNLRTLTLRKTGIADFAFLRNLPGIVGLVIESSAMNPDLSGIGEMKQLHTLRLMCKGELGSLPKGLNHLELNGVTLVFQGSKIDVENLWYLDLSNSRSILPREFVAKLKKVSRITLENMPIQDLENFRGLTDLSYLVIPTDGIANGTNGFESLSQLNLCSEKTTGLKGFDNVHELDISRTSIDHPEQIVLPKKLERIILNQEQLDSFRKSLDLKVDAYVMQNGEARKVNR